MCRDFKHTVIQLERDVIPRVEDLFVKLSGGKRFINLASTIRWGVQEAGDHKQSQGPFLCYTRLPNGVSSRSRIFQNLMETVLQGIPTSTFPSLVPTTMSISRLYLSFYEKVKFQPQNVALWPHSWVTWLIDMDSTTLKRRFMSWQMTKPHKCLRVEIFGLSTYSSKFFLPNMAEILAPLYKLLRKEMDQHWGIGLISL